MQTRYIKIAEIKSITFKEAPSTLKDTNVEYQVTIDLGNRAYTYHCSNALKVGLQRLFLTNFPVILSFISKGNVLEKIGIQILSGQAVTESEVKEVEG